MSFVPNRARRASQATGFPGWPFVDTLYDYTQILSQSSPIGKLTGSTELPVVVVGAGPAGMVAAFELFRMGFTVQVLEASDRIGGRNWSEPFASGGAFAEMGAMRVPVSCKPFWYYADWFGLQTLAFPDPGKVPTTLYYANQAYEWQPGTPPPGPFLQIQQDWDAFIDPFVDQINAAYDAGGLAAIAPVWQGFIDQYAGMSFYQALAQGIPTWGPEQLNAFGALGIGSGGFGPLYEVDFLEMLRLVVNQLEVDQLGIENGISALTQGFYATPVTLPNGLPTSLQETGSVVLQATVTGLSYGTDGNPVVAWTDAAGNGQLTEAFAVVLATTTPALEFMGLTLPTANSDGGSVQALSEDVRVAVRDLHLMSSSKMFIETATKFWTLDETVPWNIQTDEAVRGVYTLDYPQTDSGVVLISYTWGDDSDKLLALPPAERFQAFLNVLQAISPGFAAYLQPVGGQVLNIDWQAAPGYFGAFKLNYPGQEPWLQAAYFQFQTAGTPGDSGVYLAGDSVSWMGGWTEGALETGLNAAAAVAARLGAQFPHGSPFDQDPNLYQYAP